MAFYASLYQSPADWLSASKPERRSDLTFSNAALDSILCQQKVGPSIYSVIRNSQGSIDFFDSSQAILLQGRMFVDKSAQRAAISANGEVYALSFDDNSLMIENIQMQQPLRLSTQKQIFGLALSSQGEYLALADINGQISMYQKLNKRELKELWQSKDDTSFKMQFCRSDNTLITTNTDNEIQIREVASGKLKNVLRGHKQLITGMHFLPHENMLITCGIDGMIICWDLTNNSQVWNIKAADVWNLSAAHVVFTCLDGDEPGNTIVLGTTSGKIIVSQYPHQESPIIKQAHKSAIRYISYDPREQHICSTCNDGCTMLWDLSADKVSKIRNLHQFDNFKTAQLSLRTD